MTFSDWEHFISTVGIPAAIAFIILFAAWRLIKAISPVIKLWAEKQMELSESLKHTTRQQAEGMDRLVDLQKDSLATLKHHTDDHRDHAKDLQEIKGRLPK